MDRNAEHDWVERAKRGEPTAIGELYRRYWRAARAAAYGVSGNLALAEDAASEAFCAAVKSLHTLREVERFGPWLHMIVLRTARRLKAVRAVPRIAQSSAPLEEEDEAPSVRLEQQELAALVHEAVAGLPPLLREAICLFYFEGYSVAEAARFLDIPCGTLKRRLHDGRRRLQAAAEQIVQGTRPRNEEHERILRQLREAAEQGLDSEAFYRMMRQASRLGPMPRDLLQDIMKRHLAGRIPEKGPVLAPEREDRLRQTLRYFHEPSARARDPGHAVGAAAEAIRQALPEFRPWQVDISNVDLNEAARRLYEGKREAALSYLLPPGFQEETSGSYITAERSVLIEDEDGSVLTMGELLERKAAREAFEARMKAGSRFSDALGLVWKQAEPLELRAVEELLHDLAAKIVPGVAVRFLPRREPRFRASLRMELGDNPIPAATGGVLRPWSGPPEEIHVASVTIHLEPWAAARSGQVVKLADDIPLPWCR